MKRNEKIVRTILLLSTFLLGAQSIKKIKKDTIFQTLGKTIKNSIWRILSDFVFIKKAISNDWKKTGHYLGAILGPIAADEINSKFIQNHVAPNLIYRINIIPQYAKYFTGLHIIKTF